MLRRGSQLAQFELQLPEEAEELEHRTLQRGLIVQTQLLANLALFYFEHFDNFNQFLKSLARRPVDVVAGPGANTVSLFAADLFL